MQTKGTKFEETAIIIRQEEIAEGKRDFRF